ncbi:MAG: insulinase family protein [Burkholderiaceae bacterium]|nr:insulinase family protein [Burkholderiaceae bacterium]
MTRQARIAAQRARLAVRVLFAAALALFTAVVQAALPIEHWTTSNGARVYFVRADTIPMLDVRVDFDAGARLDPAGKAGLASLTAGMLDRGIEQADEAQIAERFARIGARHGAGASDDRANVSLRTLIGERQADEAVGLLASILARPTFPESVLLRERQRITQALREAETKPEIIAQWTFDAMIYGSHPYGAHATPASIAAISRDDLVAFHRAHYDAGNAVVSMIGAIDRSRAERIAERLVRDLPVGGGVEKVPDVKPLERADERRIEHPATQSHILIGQPSIARGDPDFFPLLVGNYVLGGGGFVSRLYEEVREKRGLAYSVYSYFSPKLQPGPFTIGLQTKKEQTDVALGVVRETLDRFLADGPTEQELQAAKDNLVGGFALRIDSNAKIVDNLAVIGFYRLPLDYLDRWTERVDAVTLAQVRDAFARVLDAKRMATVVVGAPPP